MAKNKEEKPSQISVVDEDVAKEYKALSTQIKTEYTLAWKNQKPKHDTWEVRLKLYNNQKRDDSAVGDTTMFTIMQTVLASLYVDKLDVEFMGREDGDDETADNLTAMADFDYDEMGKSVVDYDWDWNTCFFGHALVAMEEYERDPSNNIFVPMPKAIDPMVWLHDPRAVSPNGDRAGHGAMRFGGYEMYMCKKDMEDHPDFFEKLNFTEVSRGGGMESLLEDAQEARDEHRGTQASLPNEGEGKLGDNSQYVVTVWYTHWKGEKYKVYLVNERADVVGIKKITRKLGRRTIFPLIGRKLYPTSSEWYGTSIPDLIEDKQRARAVASNLGLKAMKADLYPMYIYDSNRIKNRNDLNFGFNKFIPADLTDGGSVNDAIQPLQKARPNMNLLDFIYQSLDVSAQKATATPELQQGAVSEEKRTLGEINIVASRVDTRYSLSAKVFGWSEAEFWYHWYALYDENFADKIDEKILRIVGAFGAKWRPVKRGDIIASMTPDIKIESKAVSRAKQLEERQSLLAFLNIALQEETANRRYAIKESAKLFGFGKDQIDRLMPPTIDERIAEDQNVLLNQDKLVPVLPEDDHNVHLEIHSKARETDATFAHIEAHKKALSIKKTRPDLFPMDQTLTNFQEGQAPPPVANVPAVTPRATRPVQPSQTSGQPSGMNEQ